MDPVTAFVNLVTSINSVIAKLLDGATPEQKAQVLQWYIDDQAKLRKFFHIDG